MASFSEQRTILLLVIFFKQNVSSVLRIWINVRVLVLEMQAGYRRREGNKYC